MLKYIALALILIANAPISYAKKCCKKEIKPKCCETQAPVEPIVTITQELEIDKQQIAGEITSELEIVVEEYVRDEVARQLENSYQEPQPQISEEEIKRAVAEEVSENLRISNRRYIQDQIEMHLDKAHQEREIRIEHDSSIQKLHLEEIDYQAKAPKPAAITAQPIAKPFSLKKARVIERAALAANNAEVYRITQNDFKRLKAGEITIDQIMASQKPTQPTVKELNQLRARSISLTNVAESVSNSAPVASQPTHAVIAPAPAMQYASTPQPVQQQRPQIHPQLQEIIVQENSASILKGWQQNTVPTPIQPQQQSIPQPIPQSSQLVLEPQPSATPQSMPLPPQGYEYNGMPQRAPSPMPGYEDYYQIEMQQRPSIDDLSGYAPSQLQYQGQEQIGYIQPYQAPGLQGGQYLGPKNIEVAAYENSGLGMQYHYPGNVQAGGYAPGYEYQSVFGPSDVQTLGLSSASAYLY